MTSRRRNQFERLPSGLLAPRHDESTDRFTFADSELRELAAIARRYGVTATDGPFYNDIRPPFISADVATVTLATTDKALYPKDNFPILGGQYFVFQGKKVQMRIFGKITTGLTPGNLTIDVYYGTGADANGVLLVSSAAVALSASQTNLSFVINLWIHCRSTGSAGTLFVDGELDANVGVIASTLQPVMIPASAAVVSGACDLTAANIISVQAKRSGSTAETMTVQDVHFVALN